MKAATVFVLTELTAFALWYFHILPTYGIACCVLGGCAAAIAIAGHDSSRKIDEAIERPVPPYGLGGCIPDLPVHASSPPQGGDATIPVEREIPDFDHCKIYHPSIRMMKIVERELWMRSEAATKSDESYEMPRASYPAFNANDIPNELFDDPRQALQAWMTINGIRGGID